MATNRKIVRGRHFEQRARDDMERDGSDDRGADVLENFSLTSEERDMRNAGRQLEHQGDVTADGVMAQLMELISRQDETLRLLEERVERMDDLINQYREIADELQESLGEEEDESHAAQQAALAGVGKVQREAEEATLRGINEATKQSKTSIKAVMESSTSYINSLTEESKRRIERLALITLPDRLFHVLKWVALILVLFILSHVAWQMVM